MQIDVLHPKGGARTVRVDGTQGSLSGNCLLPPLGASGDGSGQAILGNLLTYKSKVQGRASNRPSPIQLTLHLSPGPGDVPRRIVTEEVRGTRYEWTNEFGDVTHERARSEAVRRSEARGSRGVRARAVQLGAAHARHELLRLTQRRSLS